MRPLSIFGRLVRWLSPAPAATHDLPAVLLREFDLDDLRSLSRGSARRPFSFRIHPISELTEYRDRLFIATFPPIGDKVG